MKMKSVLTPLIWPLSLLLAVTASPAFASRKATLELLDTIPQNRDGVALVVRANGQNSAEVESGEDLYYEIESSEPGYLTLIHANSHGDMTLIRHADPDAWFVEPGSVLRYPSASDSFRLEAVTEPLGTETIYALLTDVPVSVEDISVSGGYHMSGIGSGRVEALKSYLNNEMTQGGTVAIAPSTYRVVAEAGGTEFKTRFVVRHFADAKPATEVTPANKVEVSPSSQSLSSHINFRSGSAELTRDGRRNLDVFGDALSDKALDGAVFRIVGHTDDVGESGFNMSLSEARAQSVSQYLKNQFGISQERLQIGFEGESAPLVPNTSEANRAQNRRVEFFKIR